MKKTFKKIALVLLTYIAITSIMGPMQSVFAAGGFVGLGADGKCPTGTVRLVGAPTNEPCLTQTPDLKACDGNPNLYHLADQEAMCPAAGGEVGESLTAQQTIEKFLSLIVTLEKLLNKLLWPILFLIGDLLKTDILFGAGMEDRLYNIWVPIRNIVNIVFVLGLVGLALYSVLGISGEQSNYSIKTMLPKLIAGIIAVNFSFIVIKVFLDVVNVFTTSIFAIPTQIESMEGKQPGQDESNQRDKERTKAFCEQVYSIAEHEGNVGASVDDLILQKVAQEFQMPMLTDTKQIKAVAEKFDGTQKANWNQRLEELKPFALCEKDVDVDDNYIFTSYGKQFFEKYSSNNAALAMAINMGEVIFSDKVSSGSMGSNKYESLAVNAIFSLLLYVVYVVSFAVLFIVLLARLVVLWLGIAISPVMALILTVPIAKEKLSSVEPLIGKFVAHAIAPIPIALSMTVGWIMLNAVKSTMVEGSALSGALIPSIPIPGLETLQGLMISLATVAVVWLGVFTAADSTIASGMTKVVQGKLQDFGKFIATAPIKYTPWVPVETQEGSEPDRLSISGISQVIGGASSMLENQARQKAEKVFKMNIPRGAAAITKGMGADELGNVLGEMSDSDLKSKDTYERVKALKTDAKTMGELKDKARTEKWAEELVQAIEKGDESSWEKNGSLRNLIKARRDKAEAAKKADAGKTPEQIEKEEKAEKAKAEKEKETLRKTPEYQNVETAIKTDETDVEKKKKIVDEAHELVVTTATRERDNGANFEADLGAMKRKLTPLKVDKEGATKMITAQIDKSYDGTAEEKAARKKAATEWIKANWDLPDTTPPATGGTTTTST